MAAAASAPPPPSGAIPASDARADAVVLRARESGNLQLVDLAGLVAHADRTDDGARGLDQLAELGRQWGFPADSLAKLDHVAEAGGHALELALDAGVRVGFGTDLIGEIHPAQSRELVLRSKVQSSLDVLRSATLVNAELLGRPGELGVVAPGAYADLLLVDGDPLADIEILTRHQEALRLVICGGEIVVNRLVR